MERPTCRAPKASPTTKFLRTRTPGFAQTQLEASDPDIRNTTVDQDDIDDSESTR